MFFLSTYKANLTCMSITDTDMVYTAAFI